MKNYSQSRVLRNPGSDEAVKHGCSCPVMDNAKGEGRWYGDGQAFFISTSCKLHGKYEEYEDLNVSEV